MKTLWSVLVLALAVGVAVAVAQVSESSAASSSPSESSVPLSSTPAAAPPPNATEAFPQPGAGEVSKLPDFFFKVFEHLRNQSVISIAKYDADMAECQKHVDLWQSRVAASFARHRKVEMHIKEREHHLKHLPEKIRIANERLAKIDSKRAKINVIMRVANQTRAAEHKEYVQKVLEIRVLQRRADRILDRLTAVKNRALLLAAAANATSAANATNSSSESSTLMDASAVPGSPAPAPSGGPTPIVSPPASNATTPASNATAPASNATAPASNVSAPAAAPAGNASASIAHLASFLEMDEQMVAEAMGVNVSLIDAIMPQILDLRNQLNLLVDDYAQDENDAVDKTTKYLDTMRAEKHLLWGPYKNQTRFIKWANDTMNEAREMLPQLRQELNDLDVEVRKLQPHLDEALTKCRSIHFRYQQQQDARNEQLSTLRALNRLTGEELGTLPAINLPPSLRAPKIPSSACYPSPCPASTVCAIEDCEDLYYNSVPANSTSKRPNNTLLCVGYRCDPVGEVPLRNPCADTPCPYGTRCVPRGLICETPPCPPFSCDPDQEIPRDYNSPPYTCKEIAQRAADSKIAVTSGVYILTDDVDGQQFPAYCDMTTDNGGWMLAYKQTNFESGSVKYDPNYRGASSLQHTIFNTTSRASLIGYGRPTQMLFMSSLSSNYLIVPSIESFQYWGISPSERYCLSRGYQNPKAFVVSNTWDYTNMEMWMDADIELMAESHPSISAITIGKEVDLQHAPQCLEPHCSPFRHGRYNGNCQNGNVGEGNWMIFVR